MPSLFVTIEYEDSGTSSDLYLENKYISVLIHSLQEFVQCIFKGSTQSLLLTLFSPGPGLGALLSSYLEMALHEFHRYIDR